MAEDKLFANRRRIAIEINKIVPPSEPLYIYADTMNDFNFYTWREVIAVLSSPADVKGLLQKEKIASLRVRDRDVKELTGKVTVFAEANVGSKRWRLVRIAE